ncbi:pentatricopeptide repeat-containing protein At3g61520, mitochondrial-like [Zingiber officinale]|uniref:pentatricopeptide repeat-containing protein At3g61520, mitochondrial-like n=1 Tax=Zingiber officinale TaxID=94328 RepID=UPI001C4CF047|nr:pentatricopeptide repeat-containing protein At3g61520, mitochondrial-like [Zingiber officinale]
MKLVKNPCLRLTALRRCHTASSSTDAAATDFDCDGGVGTRSDVKHQKPSSNASPRHLKYQLYSLLGSTSPGRLSAALSILRGMLPPDSTSPPDAATRSIVFSGLAKRSHPLNEESLALLVEMAKMGLFPHDAILFTQFITKLCRCGATSGAWDFFHAVKDAGGSIEAPVCNALLTGLAAIQDFARMNLLFSEMKSFGVRPDVVTFGILITCLCKSRRIDDALDVLDAMSSPDSGVTPGTIIFNTVIAGLCKAGRLQDGLSLLDRMKSSHACDPDSVTYTSLINAFCKAAELDKAHELLTRMEKERVAVDVVILNTFIYRMCRHGMIGSALNFFRKKKVEWPEVKGNAFTYTVLIGAFLHSNNVGWATTLFDEMIKEGVSPNSVTYSTLICGLTQVGKLDDAYSNVSLMRKNGFRVDIKSYNILISGFCKKKRLDKALEIHDEICEAGLRPDIFTYTSLIDAFCKAGDFSKAGKFLNKMVDNGCNPDVVTYGTLINGYCKAGDLEQAMKIFKSMDLSMVPANTVIYTTLIDSYCKNQKVDAAIYLFDEMQEKDILPNVRTYTAIFKGLKNRNMSDKAFELMDKMNLQGCKPDYGTMLLLTGWLTVIGETERLRLFVQRATSSDIDSGNPDV